MKSTNTFVLIKPDAMDRGFMGRVITRIEDANFAIHHMEQRHKNLQWAKLHYGHVADAWFFDQLIKFMTSRSMVGFIATGMSVIERLRAMIGSTDPSQAAPGTIRGDYGGYPSWHNLIHVSDSDRISSDEYGWFTDSETDVQ